MGQKYSCTYLYFVIRNVVIFYGLYIIYFDVHKGFSFFLSLVKRF